MLTDEQRIALLPKVMQKGKEPVTQVWLTQGDALSYSVRIESAACADRDARIAELEQRNRDLYEDVQRFKEHALNEKDARLVLDRELAEARKDAERYRWLRKQHWSENLISVVVRPKDQTMIGSLLPCGSLLDDTVDHMQSTQEATLKGQ